MILEMLCHCWSSHILSFVRINQCSPIAAVIFGNSSKYEHVEVTIATRFDQVKNRHVDVVLDVARTVEKEVMEVRKMSRMMAFLLNIHTLNLTFFVYPPFMERDPQAQTFTLQLHIITTLYHFMEMKRL